MVAVSSTCMVLLAGAGTAHAHPPVITMEMSLLGNFHIYRDGERQHYSMFTGRGLDRAFEGVPEAERLAQQYARWTMLGTGVTFTGNAIFLTGFWYRILNEKQRNEHLLSWAAVLGGAGMSAGGAFLTQGAKRLIFQAVNTFNAEYEPRFEPQIQIHTTHLGAVEGRFMLEWSLGRDE